jgi:NAD(P)-dependent dehydrogenase (short-subunit alcohol dehydrogenase family)
MNYLVDHSISMCAVNNAGNGAATPTLDSTAEGIEDLFRSNVYGPIYVTQAVVPHMPPGGRIINISSVGSKLGLEAMPLYCATKAALDSLTYIWAAEVRQISLFVKNLSLSLLRQFEN